MKKNKLTLLGLICLTCTTGCFHTAKNKENNTTTPNKLKKGIVNSPFYEQHKSTYSNFNKGYNWELIWSEEFNEGKQPNPKIWTYGEGYIRKNAKSYYTIRPKNIRLEYGCLVIEAHKEQFKNKDYTPNSNDPLKQQFATYTSGRLKTANKFSFKYGKIDVRAKIQSGSGAWSQLSLINNNADPARSNWPDCGEILLLAYRGQHPDTLLTSVFSKNYRWDHSLHYYNPTKEFHIWSVEWSKDQLRFYLDGKLYNIVNKYKTNGEKIKNWPFNQEFCFYLDLIIGGSWSPAIDDKIFPVKLKVDYIRIYKDKNNQQD